MREYRFDVVRVVCMTYLVTYIHLYEYIYPQGRMTPYLPLCIAMAHACLGVFTFVSGYLLGKKYSFGQQGNSDVWTFYKKRILRIIPLFVVSSIALWLIRFNDTDATWNGLLCISPFVKSKPRTLYYIPIILWCYVMTPLISRRGLRWRIFACLAIWGIIVIARVLFPSIDSRFIFNVFFYFVGVVSAYCFDWKFNTTYGSAVKTAFVFVFALLGAAAIRLSVLTTIPGQMTTGALGVFAILFVSEGISKLLFEGHEARQNVFRKSACWLVCIVSYASMACYMFHRLFFWLAEAIWNPSDVSTKWLYMAGCAFPVVVTLSYLIQKLYDRLVKKQRWLWLSMALFVVLCCSGYQACLFVDREFMAAKELPCYDVGSRSEDDTIRVVIIGDSWAELHHSFNRDTLLEKYAGGLSQKPVKCLSRGKGGALSKEIYYFMHGSSLRECAQTNDFSTKPLLEMHPDYCVVMSGINDTWKKRPVSYYTGNYQLMIKLLLANGIRPVVMEIPDFEMGEWLDTNRKRERRLYRLYSFFTGVEADDITPFREGLRNMLKETRLADSVLYIPAGNWLPREHHYSEQIYQIDHVHLNIQGYHLLDSCIASEIIKDYLNTKGSAVH